MFRSYLCFTTFSPSPQLGLTLMCRTYLENLALMIGYNGRSTPWFLLCQISPESLVDLISPKSFRPH